MFGWIVLGVVILIAVVSAISQMVKSQDEANPNPRKGRGGRSGDGVRTSSSGDIDRFLQEIDRLRKKGAGAAPPVKEKGRAVAKPARTAVPVVEPTRRRGEPDQRPVPTSRRGIDLPVAAVVADEPPAPRKAPRAVASQPTTSVIREGGRSRSQVPSSIKGQHLLALLQDPQSMPVAVVLHAVLGPPKCKHG